MTAIPNANPIASMALFDFLKKSSQNDKPVIPQNALYEMLFCDDINLYENLVQEKHLFPWNILFSNSVKVDSLLEILENPETETRVKILAHHQLREYGHPVLEKELLAVIVEVSMEQGLDVLASYQDGSARFISYSGKVIIWDTPNTDSAKLIRSLFENSRKIVQQIGPWEKGRLNAPKIGNSRITFLVCDGLYFGEAPTDVLFNDPLAREAMHSATALLDYLTGRAVDSRS